LCGKRLTAVYHQHDLRVIPVLNKIDLPAADVGRVVSEMESIFGIDPDEAIAISAKNGINVSSVLKVRLKR